MALLPRLWALIASWRDRAEGPGPTDRAIGYTDCADALENLIATRPRHPPEIRGAWPEDGVHRAFVDGVAWWEFQKTTATIWSSDRDAAEYEALRRYGPVLAAFDGPTCPFCYGSGHLRDPPV